MARGVPVTPCTPYCPGVSGFPELECNGCQSLFHSKCAGIAPNRVAIIKHSFRCKVSMTQLDADKTRSDRNLFAFSWQWFQV